MELPRVQVHGAPPTGVGSQWPCPRGGGESLPPATQYVKNHVDSSWSRRTMFLCYCTIRARALDGAASLVVVNFVPVSPRGLAVAVQRVLV